MSPAKIVAIYLERRLELIRRAEPGTAAARELSVITDRAVSSMMETALSRVRAPWSVLALGGWGAGRLLPGSDLDFLVVTDASAAELKPALEAVLYPLWDAGLAIGHQVRSMREHARFVRDDHDTLTATLTGRALAGDTRLGAVLLADVASAARTRERGLMAALAARPRPGSPYLLEPDLKDGAGGQRDLDELTWLAAVVTGEPSHTPAPLAGAGLLADSEAARLAVAGDRITRARWQVHAATARAASTLTSDLADDGSVATDGLHEALADTHHILMRVRARAGTPARRPWPLRTPRAPGISGGAEAACSPLSADELLEMLGRGPESAGAIEEAAWAGRLDDVVPGMRDLMVLRRPGLGHRYTVGAHSIRCATLVGQAAHRHGLIARPALLTAALLHDVGKVRSGPGHAALGAEMASTIAPRLGLAGADLEDVRLLVGEHLLLPEVASTEDLHDEDVLLAAANRARRPDLVLELLALAEADAEATGQQMWSPWHAALLGELADRLVTTLSEDVEGTGIVERAEAVRREALLATAPHSAEASFVRAAHLRYLAAHTPAEVSSHAALVAEATGAGPDAHLLAVTAGRAARTWRVTVVANDRPGLFATVAGALALNGLDILAADAFSAGDGIALDTFTVRTDTLAEADAATWAALERTLSGALEGSLDVPARLAERLRAYGASRGGRPTVSVEHAGAYATALFVSAPDRIGLLYDLARAIADAGLDIRWARVSTRAGRARDVFHVVDAAGDPVTDPGELGHLAMLVRDRA